MSALRLTLLTLVSCAPVAPLVVTPPRSPPPVAPKENTAGPCQTDADCVVVASTALGVCCPWVCGGVVVTKTFAQKYAASVAHCPARDTCVENDCACDVRVLPTCAAGSCRNQFPGCG